jgi:hypothetical protein
MAQSSADRCKIGNIPVVEKGGDAPGNENIGFIIHAMEAVKPQIQTAQYL